VKKENQRGIAPQKEPQFVLFVAVRKEGWLCPESRALQT